MTEDDDSSNPTPWKDRWNELSAKGKALSEDLGSKMSEAGRKISDASTKAATQAKEGIEEARLKARIAALEARQRDQDDLIKEMSNLVEEMPEPNQAKAANRNEPAPRGDNIGFFATIKQTPSLVGFAVLWALLLLATAKYAEDNDLQMYDYSVAPFVWIIGTMVWSIVVLTQISSAGSFATLPIAFRVQATIGVGVATASISFLPEITRMSAMFNIFSWLVIVALTILTASAVMNGFRTITGR